MSCKITFNGKPVQIKEIKYTMPEGLKIKNPVLERAKDVLKRYEMYQK